jgi:hypothetical protein
MSTFKVQPIYAELILGWLDMAYLGTDFASVTDVLRAVSWMFKGGVLGDYPMRWATDSSMTRFPAGLSTVLSELPDEDLNRRALMDLLKRRAGDRRRAARSRYDWTASFHAMRASAETWGITSPAMSGMHGVYRVLAMIWTNCEAPARDRDYAALRTYVRECTVASAAASMLHVPTCDHLCQRTFEALGRTRLASLRHAAGDFHRALRHSGSQSARSASVQAGRRIVLGVIAPAGLTATELGASRFTVAGSTFMVMHGCAFVRVGGVLVALSRSDMQRVHQFLTGAQSGLFATVAQACVAPGPEREAAAAIGQAYERQVSRILDGAPSVPQGDEVVICKAFKRAFGAYLGELAGPLCREETRELWAETVSTKGAQHLDLAGWVAEIRSWSAGTSFNLGKVYKLCPAPDASPGLTLIERHEMVCNHNAFDPTISGLFRAELRSQILRAHIRTTHDKLELRAGRPAWFSAYRAGKYDEVPSDEIHQFLRWEATGVMPTRSPDNPAIWKDSGLGWDTYETACDPDRVARHGNMLTRMVFDSNIPMPGVRHFGHPHDQKMDIKPEGHKDPARGIYSGNLPDRLNQSWMEAAVQSVARAHPAFMIGADSETREARVRTIVERPHDHTMVAIYYSFDIAGWSPRMTPEAQRISHEIWAELFDEPLFRSAHTINENVRVYMNKQGFTGWFINPGANFEGYNGKEMTMILVALMSLAVKEWRARIVASGGASALEARSWAAVLLAYIDDGLAKLVLPRDRAAALFTVFKSATVDTFARCGYTIEMSKCYPSDRFAIFLNEPYLAGRHVTHGTRAAMTICAENTEEHTSLLERTTAVSTGCRGAVMAGLDALVGAMLQAYHVYSHLVEWTHRPDPVVAAVWSMMPRGWGGIGLPTCLQLGTSGSGSALEESVRTMQKWSAISTPARLAFLKCAKTQMAPRQQVGVLMAPLGGRLRKGVMVETRVPDAVRSALAALQKDGRLSRLARDFLGYSSPESLASYAGAVISMQPSTVLQEQLISDLASAHPHALFSAFARRIEKSTTLMQLVGQREMRRIMRANREDAASSYAALKENLTV